MRFVVVTLLLISVQAAQADFTPTCTVKVTAQQHTYLPPLMARWLPGRLVRVTPDLSCPKNGAAYVRFRSRWGTQPDAPPGWFTLRPGETITRRVPWDWWVETRSKGLTWIRQEESP